jgi:ABC-type transport system substrate-binding protein
MQAWRLLVFLFAVFSCALVHAWVLNNPYPKNQSHEKILYTFFAEQPKTLDPARSYSSNEYRFTAQIYEPLLEYDYFKRPYELKPLTLAEMPNIKYLDAKGKPMAQGLGKPAYTVYTLRIKQGIFYQPHPAFAKDKEGAYLYHNLSKDYVEEHHIHRLSDFPYTGTRELLADDYIYELKRLANPAVSSPIYGLLKDHVIGFKAFARSLPKFPSGANHYVDLRRYPLEGVKKIDDYSFEIRLKGEYKQFLFWLSLPFFSPIPWEADRFYAQPDMDENNLNLGWYPVGTGPFMLTENNPNKNMLLEKNPNYHEAYYPAHGSLEDGKQGYLKDAGKRLPLIDKALFTLEKESIPRWNKFVQGYYDVFTVSSESFDKAIRINAKGQPELSREMRDKKVHLTQTIQPHIHYIGFNMLDPTVGGASERARKLRQALSLAVNIDEEISIFYNGRGRPAQGPVPPGIFGFQEGPLGINSFVYEQEGKRRSLEEAKKQMREAGYPEGVDPKTKKPLILNYDVVSVGPEDKAMFDWMRKQFAALGIDLNVRATLYNRFQEKVRAGDVQIFAWGWDADYPDPENFMFQLYSRNGKVRFGGENAANYSNPKYDRLFEQMKNRNNDATRQDLINQMLAIVRFDAPWIWGLHAQEIELSHSWVSRTKPNTIFPGTLKYISIDVEERTQMRALWNQAIFWPLLLFVLLLFALCAPLVVAYRRKEQEAALRMHL